MQGYRKQEGQKGEMLVRSHYETLGYILVKQNFTFPGGEIDLIFEGKGELVFVEVKVVHAMEDLMNYITPQKLKFLERSMETFVQNWEKDLDLRLDVVFVQGSQILEIFENVSNT